MKWYRLHLKVRSRLCASCTITRKVIECTDKPKTIHLRKI